MKVKISTAILILILLSIINCNSKKEIVNIEINIDIKKEFKKLSFKKSFSKSLDVLSIIKVNPYENGVMVIRKRGNTGFLTTFNFEGNIIYNDTELIFDIQVPDKLSYASCFYDQFNKKIYNMGFPFLKTFNIKNLKAKVICRLSRKSKKFHQYIGLITSGIHNGSTDYYIFPFEDMLAGEKKSRSSEKYVNCFGICRLNRDFSGWKTLKKFYKTYTNIYKKKGANIVIHEADPFFGKTHEHFPFTIDPLRKKVYFIQDIWTPEFSCLGFNGFERVYKLKLKKSEFSSLDKQDYDIWFKYLEESISPHFLKFVKRDYKYAPYLFDIMEYKNYILLVSGKYNEPERERIVYILDAENLDFLGLSYIPSTGPVENSFIFNDYYVEVSFIEGTDEVLHNISVYKINLEK